MATTQNTRILTFLKSGKTLTAAQAKARFGVQNLRARINELRQDGAKIVTKSYTRRDGVVAGLYSLAARKR